MRLREDERRYVLLLAGSLLVAIVCFGVLQSSGTFANGAFNIGGALVGFLAAFWFGSRYWVRGPTLEEEALKAKKPLFVEDLVKVLDLRDAPPTAEPQEAQLSDYYRVRRTAEGARLSKHYATSGSLRLVSTSLPDRSNWVPGPTDHTGLNGEQFVAGADLEIDLTQSTEREAIPVVTQIVYANAFCGMPQESLETHVDYPTGRVAFLIFMPDGYRCTAAIGKRRESRDKATQISPDPVRLEDGSLIYWAVEKPDFGARYGIVWTWEERGSTS
jgi:hypothetical protein